MQSITRVYSKAGFIKTVYLTDLNSEERHNELISDGWIHTSTIDPAKWIEALMNGTPDNSDAMMDELNFGPNPNHPIYS